MKYDMDVAEIVLVAALKDARKATLRAKERESRARTKLMKYRLSTKREVK